MGGVTPTVVLRPAYEWTCDNCGRDQFGRSEAVGQERLEEFVREELGFQGDVNEQEWTILPQYVTCAFCGAKFETTMEQETW